MGAGAGGVSHKEGGSETGQRADGGAAAAAGGGAGGTAGQTVAAEEPQPQHRGPAQGAGSKVENHSLH